MQYGGRTKVVAPVLRGVDKGTPVFAQIADQLVDAIASGAFPVGHRLPSEGELAERFGVSRASVREALCSLQFAGYVESRRGSGTMVRSMVPQGTGKMTERGPETPSGIIDLLEARLAIEPEVARQAALDPAPDSLPLLVELLRGMELSVSRPHSRAHTDLNVHLALIRTCRNPFLVEVAGHLIARSEGELWRSIRDRAWDEGRLPQTWLGHHHAIGKAVTEGQPDRAEIGVRAHLLSVLANVARSTRLSTGEKDRVDTLTSRYGVGV